MKNNLIGVDLDNSFWMDERLPGYSDLLEIIVTNKIQRGDFDDIVEEMTAALDWTDCDCSCDEDCEDECEALNGRRAVHFSDVNGRNFLSAGYTDCMDEAIRFLVEEENISPEHPVVLNLKAHLEQSRDRILETVSQFESQNLSLDVRCSSNMEHVPFHVNPACAWNAG